MKLYGIILVLVEIAMANPLPQSPEGIQNIQITFSKKKSTSEVSTTAWNADKSSVVGQSCSTILSNGPFEAHSISFMVDENGSGNITIGTQTYVVHDDTDISGGISCGRMHSSLESIVNCAVTVPASLQLQPLSKRDLALCFPEGPLQLEGILAGIEARARNPEAFNIPPSNISKRELGNVTGDPCDRYVGHTRRIGDGNPHQNPMNVQLTVGHRSFTLHKS